MGQQLVANVVSEKPDNASRVSTKGAGAARLIPLFVVLGLAALIAGLSTSFAYFAGANFRFVPVEFGDVRSRRLEYPPREDLARSEVFLREMSLYLNRYGQTCRLEGGELFVSWQLSTDDDLRANYTGKLLWELEQRGVKVP